MDTTEKTLYEKFYTDPSWQDIENKIMGYVRELEDFTTLDETLPAETLKAQVTARKIAKDALIRFLNDCGIIRRNLTTPKATFK